MAIVALVSSPLEFEAPSAKIDNRKRDAQLTWTLFDGGERGPREQYKSMDER